MGAFEENEQDFARAVGRRLREIRVALRRSLSNVAADSNGEFGAAALGAYERGSRSISALRLKQLASLYGVPLVELLPGEGDPPGLSAADRAARDAASIRVNVAALRSRRGEVPDTVRRFVERVRTERGDFNGGMITMRREDVRILGAALGFEPEEMLKRLDDLGVIARRGADRR